MNIAYFTDTYRPQINGVVTSIDSFASQLRKQGHEVTVIAPKTPKYKNNNENVIEIRSLKFKPYPDYRIALPLALRKKDFSKYDIIHVHTPSFVGLAGIRIAHKNNIPLVMTFHTKFSDYAHYVSKGAIIEKAMKKGILTYRRHFFNKADMIITPTDEIKKELIMQEITKPIKVIPSGIDIEPVEADRMEVKEKYGFTQSEKIILHVGRVTKEKNIIMILDAFTKLQDDKIKLIITSDGPYRKALEKYVKKNKIQNVLFTGYLSGNELKECYSMADVFVMASETETQGIVILEALAQKLPIVVTDAPVIGDFVRSHKIGLISEKTPESLAKTLEQSLREGNRFESERKETLKEFSSGTCTNEMIKLYENLIHDDTVSS